MSADEHQLTPAEQTICDALVGAYLRDPHLGIDSDGRARAIVARLRPLLAAEVAPDIVTGEQARKLPPGSRVVRLDDDGVARVGCSVASIGSKYLIWPDNGQFLVLYRAPAPVPKVGDVVTSEAELAALPFRAVVRDVDGDICERRGEQWRCVSGVRGVTLPARVLDLGGDS